MGSLINPFEKNVQKITESAEILTKNANFFDFSQENLPLSTPPSSFKTHLHDYQKQALSWMLLREGVGQIKQENVRILHPLWEQYNIHDNHIYFNPFSG